MRNAGLDEAVGIKIAGRKISPTSDMQIITLLAEAEKYLYSPWNSPGQNTRVGSCSLLQGIFPTQGSNPGLPHCRWILYQLSHQGSPIILEWGAYPSFSSRSSQLRNQTGVSWIAGRFFTNWAIREAPRVDNPHPIVLLKIHKILGEKKKKRGKRKKCHLS